MNDFLRPNQFEEALALYFMFYTLAYPITIIRTDTTYSCAKGIDHPQITKVTLLQQNHSKYK